MPNPHQPTSRCPTILGTIRIVIAVACALALPVHAQVLEIRGVPKTESTSVSTEPAHGVPATRRVGENMIRYVGTKEIVYKIPKDTIVLQEKAGSTWGFLEGRRRVVGQPGTAGPYRTWGDGFPILCITPHSVSTEDYGETAGCFIDTDGDGKFDASVFPRYSKRHEMDAPVAYKHYKEATEERRTVETGFSFVTEIMYQGISKGEIRVSYREFKGGLARPAFTQDLTYEIDPDGTSVIVFRDVKLKVLKATREDITYVVEEPRLLPAAPPASPSSAPGQ